MIKLYLFAVDAKFYQRYTWRKAADNTENECQKSLPLNVVAKDVEEAIAKYKVAAMKSPVEFTEKYHNDGGDPIYPTRVVVKKAELLHEVHVA